MKSQKIPYAEGLFPIPKKSAQRIIDESEERRSFNFKETKELLRERERKLRKVRVKKSIAKRTKFLNKKLLKPAPRSKGRVPKASVQKGTKTLWNLV